MGRTIAKKFFDKVKSGAFSDIIEEVNKDNDLVLFLRGKYISVYYNTLQILKIHFDTKKVNYKYFKKTDLSDHFEKPSGKSPECKVEISKFDNSWKKYFEVVKDKIREYQKSQEERNYQQELVRQNQFPKSEYQIIDVEYAQNSIIPRGSNKRFDALAVYKIEDKKLGLAFIELKAGDGAINGKAGVYKHLCNAGGFYEDLKKKGYLNAFYEDLNNVIGQLEELTMPQLRGLKLDKTIKPQMIFALADLPRNEQNSKTKDQIKKCKAPNLYDKSKDRDENIKNCKAAKMDYEVLFDFSQTKTNMELKYSQMRNLNELELI